MKFLLCVRHAKSSWDDTSVDDFDRPLNQRGKKDAPEMAMDLVQEKVKIGAFLSSPAKRARKTAEIFIKAYNYEKEAIIYVNELYNASATVFYKVVTSLDDAVETAALFSHNPGTTDFVNTLTDMYVDNVPTCGIFAVKVHCDTWLDFPTAKKEFWFFKYPKLKQH